MAWKKKAPTGSDVLKPRSLRRLQAPKAGLARPPFSAPSLGRPVTSPPMAPLANLRKASKPLPIY